jgi:hypothetical protein
MPQAFLGANPGTSIQDSLEPVLMTAETVSNATTTGTWIQVNFPADLVAVLEVGSMASTAALEVEIQAADDTSATNLVSLGRFAAVGDTDDDQDRFLSVQVYKPFVRALATESATADAVVDKITLRPKEHVLGNTRTA